MADFPRTVYPAEATPFGMPGPLIARARSGKTQFRSFGAVGRIWEETYPLIEAKDPVTRAWLAAVAAIWGAGTFFDISHPAYLTPNGSGGGTPLVKGASQVGGTLLTDGWPSGITVLKAGDIVRLSGLNYVMDAQADVVSDGSGNATILVNPIMFVGSSPADNAPISYTGVKLRAALIAAPDLSSIARHGFVGGIKLSFAEMP